MAFGSRPVCPSRWRPAYRKPTDPVKRTDTPTDLDPPPTMGATAATGASSCRRGKWLHPWAGPPCRAAAHPPRLSTGAAPRASFRYSTATRRFRCATSSTFAATCWVSDLTRRPNKFSPGQVPRMRKCNTAALLASQSRL